MFLNRAKEEKRRKKKKLKKDSKKDKEKVIFSSISTHIVINNVFFYRKSRRRNVLFVKETILSSHFPMPRASLFLPTFVNSLSSRSYVTYTTFAIWSPVTMRLPRRR